MVDLDVELTRLELHGWAALEGSIERLEQLAHERGGSWPEALAEPLGHFREALRLIDQAEKRLAEL